MGAFKSGVSIVTFDEKDSIDSLNQTLKDSGARGLLFSPQTVVNQESHANRATFLQKLFPELHSLYPGDELALKAYPHLKQIIQLGHTTIRGVIKFKDAMVYAQPNVSTSHEIPENSPTDDAFQAYVGGKQVASFTNGDLASNATKLWSSHFSKAGEQPVFISLNLETPLGLTSFLANNINFQKVYIPSSFSMSKILNSLKTQSSSVIVTDRELYELEVPQQKQSELVENTSTVTKVIVASSNKIGKSALFTAREVASIDPYTLQ